MRSLLLLLLLSMMTEKHGCQKSFTQSAYRTAKTTIRCDDPGHKDEFRVNSICKERDAVCDDILSTKSSPKSNGSFTLTETNSGFTVSISNVSTNHAGVYWCTASSGNYRAALRKIKLEVKATITNFTRSLTIGQDFTYWCDYPDSALIKKFICKGEDPSTCETLASTAQLNTRFSVKDDRVKRNITITVREVTAEDAGTYWCGAQSTDHRYSDRFFHRFLMKVGGSSSTVIIIMAICIAVLLLLLVLVLIFKRLQRSTDTKNGETQNNKEVSAYEEIQERPRKPDSRTPPKTIYVTANFPTSLSSASHHYSNFQNSKISGNTHSAVKYSDQHPTNLTVNHPPTIPEDPFCSTLKKPQEP